MNKDKIVRMLMSEVAKRKDALEKVNKPQWKTSGVIELSDRNSAHATKQLKTIRNPDNLVKVLATIILESDALDKASVLLNHETSYNNGGYSKEEWLHDFKLQMSILTSKSIEDELKEYESRLDKLISKEERDRIELENLAESLGVSIEELSK